MLRLLRRRFLTYKSPLKLRAFAVSLIDEAYENFWTGMYAKFQVRSKGS